MNALARASLCAAVLLAACGRIRAPLPPPRAPLVATEDSAVRRHPPRPFAPRAHPLPTIQQFTLENGFTVYLVEVPSVNTVATQLICRRCGDDEPATPPGLAALTWRTLARTARGTHARAQGLSIDGSATLNSGGLSVDAPSERLSDALRLLATAVGAERVSTEALELERSAMQEARVSTPHTAIELLEAAIFGPHHPYGRQLFELRESLRQVVPAWVESYRRAHLVAPETALIVAGHTTRATLEPVARLMFGSWPHAVTAPRTPTPSEPLRTRAMFFDEGHVGLARILLAMPGVARSSADYPAMQLLQEIVGGLFRSRLSLTLRESLGLVYSSGAASVSLRDAGMLLFGTEVETLDALQTLGELLAALRGVHDGGISRDELVQARRTWHTRMHARMESLDFTINAVASLFENGLPADEYERLGTAIDRLTAADLDRVAAARIRTDDATMLIDGDWSVIGAGLQRMVGYVEFLNGRL